MKRAFDLLAAIPGLIAVLPLMLATAAAIKLNSPGPVFFRQRRVGRHGVDFIMYKFRSMTVLADAEKGRFDVGDISRVTAVGKIIRKMKIDELPQLWNVIKGDMSLVGPRPEIRKWVAAYPERWSRVLTVRPGITDPASIVYCNEEEVLTRSADPERTFLEEILPHKLSMYEAYVDKNTFRGDMGILLKTFLVMARS